MGINAQIRRLRRDVADLAVKLAPLPEGEEKTRLQLRGSLMLEDLRRTVIRRRAIRRRKRREGA